ncbi:MAG: DUF4230 domain-containing protein [Spirochaetales bacterium]
MKIKTYLTLGAVCIIGLVFLFFLRPSLSLLSSTRRTVASQSLWERVRALPSLHTLRYIRKVVFPYDYLDPSLNFATILTLLRHGKGSVNTLLSPKEKNYLEARELSDKIGLRISGSRREFVVVTTRISVGIDLKELELEPVSDSTLKVFLPPPRITELVIEDAFPANYPYPDASITPLHWKWVAEFVLEKIREEPLEASIIRSAKDQAIHFLASFFRQAGFLHVEFSPVLSKEVKTN